MAETPTDPEAEDWPLPQDVVREAVRLTRHAWESESTRVAATTRRERDRLLADHGYEPRVREGDEVLVLYPTDWITDGAVDRSAIEDTDRAIEVPLEDAGNSDRYEAVATFNRAVVERVADDHGRVHAATAEAFATFLNNHYVCRIDHAGPDLVREFTEEYFPRNAWPTDAQRAELTASLRLTFEAADAEPPAFLQTD